MSSQIEYVKLVGNMLFSQQGGGYSEQRESFMAGGNVELSEHRGVGVDVVWKGKRHTIPWAQIAHVTYADDKPLAEVKKPAA